MSLPADAYYPLAPNLKICRILNGMWQVAGSHGAIDPQTAIAEMFQYVDAGFGSWDLADEYGPAEDWLGEFRQQWIATRSPDAESFQALTRWVPRPGRMTRKVVEYCVNVSRKRMNTPVIDLMQFHWWDYHDLNYLDALKHLADLQAEGVIKQIGLTNFDTTRLEIIVEAGIPIVSNQVQFSVLDRRPLKRMTDFCQANKIALLCYGSMAGGLFSKHLIGEPEPGRMRLNTASLRKYKQMIDEWGDWKLFQELLLTLQSIAYKHHVSVPNVAVRYILEQPAVAGVIIGTRLGRAEHVAENSRVFDFQLDAQDYDRLDEIQSRSVNLFETIGDCGDEYRY